MSLRRATLSPVIEDPDRCYQAAQSKDARFDGEFFFAVTSTGIYCRPSCPARTPKRENVRFYATAAAAQQAGFRACLRCRPDATPGSPEWNIRADVVARAMRLIRDGVVDREGVEGLAAASATACASSTASSRPRWAPGRSPSPGPSAARRPACCSRPPISPSPTWPSPPASPACASATTPCARSSPTPRAGCGPGRRGRRGPALQAAARHAGHPAPPALPAALQPRVGPRLPRGARPARHRGARRCVLPRSLRLPHGHGFVTLRAGEPTAASEARPTSKPSSSCRTCATCRPPWRAAASCSTSMPTPSPFGRPCAATRSSARWCGATRAPRARRRRRLRARRARRHRATGLGDRRPHRRRAAGPGRR